MKRIFSFCLLSIFASSQLKAQALFTTHDSVNINNINARVLIHGDMWWDPAGEVAACQYPPNAPTNINFASAIWMSGYDAGNNLHIAAQTYRQDGNDYWPGPLDASDTITYATSQTWAKIWKVNRTDIQYFQSLSTHTTANTPSAILTWPAKGNTNAQGNGGAPLTISNDMAPFVDLNSNGIYEPLLGEYPDVPGDQALWWTFSDRGPTHTQTKGKALGVEVHAMAYAYNRGNVLDNIIYYDYNIVNRSANNYHNFRIGQWDDIDLGYYLDDYIGFDSVHRMGIGYNGTNDDGLSGGHPANSYGIDPPQAGLTMIVLPGDVGATYVPLGSFMYFNNDFSVIGNPTIDTEFNYYMRAKIRNGKPIDSVFTGALPCGVTNLNYVYPGDPSDSATWNECTCGNTPGDRRFVLSSNDFTLTAGGTQHVVFALVVADSAKGCPNATFDNIKSVADSAWYYYHNPLPPKLAVENNVTLAGNVKVYPNPAHDKIYLEARGQLLDNVTITIYNYIGQVMHIPTNKNGGKCEMDVNHLPAGVYNILYRNGNTAESIQFIKE